MRFLFLSNLFPPTGNGGYELWCQEVAEGLCARGHIVRVLTSRLGPGKDLPPEPDWVHRRLHMEMRFGSQLHWLHFFTRRGRNERRNLAILREMLAEFQPDAVMVWGMWNLHRSLPALAERLLPGRVVYYLADYWPTLPSQHEFYWRSPGKSRAAVLIKGALRPLARRLLAQDGRPPLHFERALLPSAFLRDELLRRGVPIKDARIIYGAVDTHPFLPSTGSRHSPNGTLSLLYAGRLAPEKGIETAIDAVQNLVYARGIRSVRLTIVGTGRPSYVTRLYERVNQAGLDEFVSFSGPTPKEEMPGLYRRFDAFLFTSTWQEPFGRVLVEALASGVVVIATATGGAAEIVEEDENALTFLPGDSSGLASQVIRLLQQPSLRRRLTENGQRTAQEKFDLSRMVSEIESYLLSVQDDDRA